MAKKLKDNAGTGSDGGASGLESGFQWTLNTNPTIETELTFSFAEESKNGKVQTYSLDEMKTIIDILVETDANTGLGFTLVIDTSDSYYSAFFDELETYLAGTGVAIVDAEPDTADIRFSQKELNSSFGIANYPGNGPGGDVVFDSATLNDMGGDAVTDFEYELFYHEIGHALGLRHTTEKLFKNGELNAGYTGADGEPLEIAFDDTGFSHMSYNDADTFVVGWTPQDLFALQNMYGDALI